LEWIRQKGESLLLHVKYFVKFSLNYEPMLKDFPEGDATKLSLSRSGIFGFVQSLTMWGSGLVLQMQRKKRGKKNMHVFKSIHRKCHFHGCKKRRQKWSKRQKQVKDKRCPQVMDLSTAENGQTGKPKLKEQLIIVKTR
jgi:hypothetical protein